MHQLPSSNADIQIRVLLAKERPPIFISHTVHDYCNAIKCELVKLCMTNERLSYTDIVHKNLGKNVVQDEIAEIIDKYHILGDCKLSILHLTPEYKQTVAAFHSDHVHYTIPNCVKYDMVIFDAMNNDSNTYAMNMLYIVHALLDSVKPNGTCLIKIRELVHKPILDAVYMLTSMFETVSVFKPDASSVFTTDKYLICEHRTFKNIIKTSSFTCTTKQIVSLIDRALPMIFVNRINEINNMIGSHQLDAFDGAIELLHRKTKRDCYLLQRHELLH
jgi:hypothetical protein